MRSDPSQWHSLAEPPDFIGGCSTELDDDRFSAGNRGELLLSQRKHHSSQIAIRVAAQKKLACADLQHHNFIAHGELVIAEELDLDARPAPESVRGPNPVYAHYRPQMHSNVTDEKGTGAGLSIEIDVADDPGPTEAESDVLDRRVRRQN